MTWKNSVSAVEPFVAGDLPLACRTRVAVLITDQSATTRAMLAFLIHTESIGAHRPFVSVPNRRRSGLEARSSIRHARQSIATDDLHEAFRHAKGGTVFIDEVHRLSASAQAWLFEHLAIARRLRSMPRNLVHEESAVRVIVGCSHSLFDDVVARRFDESLFYRLNVIQVNSFSLAPIGGWRTREPGVG
jgi:DNA-binding NtrC family response regulator